DIAKAASRDAGAERLIAAVCEKLISLEEALNDLDAKAGDGDTGSTVATGARSVLDRVDTLPLAHQAATLATIGDTLGTSMGGSSGVLLSIFFTAAAQSLNGGAPLS
ncbi:MAG: DAK2 domain-containing protein, partial [Mesorhizobium sp.]